MEILERMISDDMYNYLPRTPTSDTQVKDYSDYYIAMTRLNASNEGPQNE